METHPIQTENSINSELRLFRLETTQPVVLIFPAMGVPARKYDELAASLNGQGLQVAIAELRGIETSSVRASRSEDFGYKEMIEIDFPLALKQVTDLFPKQPVFLLGHSLGGQLAVLMMAKLQAESNTTPAGLILSASCSIHYRGWAFPKSLFILFFTQFAALVTLLLGYFPGKKLGFGGREAKTVILDWARSARTGKYKLSNSDFNYEAALNELQAPIFGINYTEDNFAPQAATDLLLNKISKANIQRAMLKKEDLGAKKADHFSWLKHPSHVAKSVHNWIDLTLSKSRE